MPNDSSLHYYIKVHEARWCVTHTLYVCNDICVALCKFSSCVCMLVFLLAVVNVIVSHVQMLTITHTHTHTTTST